MAGRALHWQTFMHTIPFRERAFLQSSSRAWRLAGALALTPLAAALSMPGFAQAQPAQTAETETEAARQSFRIAAGPLGQALAEFSAAAGVALSSDAALTRTLQSPGLNGRYSVAEGFAVLLAGSALQAQRTPQGHYVLVPSAAPVSTAPKALQAVRVTATRTEHDLRDIPLSVSVVGAQDFERKPHTNVGDQLRDIPGVQLAGANVAGDRRIMIRGHAAGATLVLIDGVRQPEIRNTAGAGFTISAADIERIEVIKGPASVLYGSDAIGGVVNIITKKGGDKPFGASIGMVADSSNGSIEPRLSLYGKASGFYYRLTGNGLNADERRAGDHTRLFNSDYRQRNFRGLAGYEWDKGSVQFTAERFEGVNNYTPVIAGTDGRFRPAAPAERATVSEVPQNDRSAYVLSLKLKGLSENLVGLKSHLYHQKLDKGFDYYTYRTGVYSGRHLYQHEAWGGSLQTDWVLFDQHLLSVGVDYDDIRMDKNDYLAPVGTANGSMRTVALFAQNEWSLRPDLMFTAGVRQTWIETALQRDTLNPARADSRDYANLVGSAGLVYRGIEDVALRGLFSQGFKAPNLTQMLIGSGVIIPNPSLKPEESNSFELGMRYSRGNFNTDLAVFHSTFRNGIVNEIVSTNPTRWQAYNVDRARSLGAELSADYRFPGTGFKVYGDVNLLRYETENQGGFKTRHSSRSPLWGTLGMGWEKALGAGHTVFVDANMMGGKGAYTLRANGAVSDRTDGWGIFNLSVGLAGGGDKPYNLTLAVRNLFDRYYQVASPFSPSSPLPETGRHAVLSFNVAF